MAIASKKVYLTASAFIAFINRSHSQFNQATAYFRYFAKEGYFLYTANLTIIETAQRLQAEISPSIAKDFLRTVFSSNIEIIWSTESDEKAALRFYLNYQAAELTFSQALIAVFCDRRNISRICTFEYFQPVLGLTNFSLPY